METVPTMFDSPEIRLAFRTRETCIPNIDESNCNEDNEVDITYLPECSQVSTSDDYNCYPEFECCQCKDNATGKCCCQRDSTNQKETPLDEEIYSKRHDDVTIERGVNHQNEDESLSTENSGDMILDMELMTSHIEQPPKYATLIEWILEDAPPNYSEATGKTINVDEVRIACTF